MPISRIYKMLNISIFEGAESENFPERKKKSILKDIRKLSGIA